MTLASGSVHYDTVNYWELTHKIETRGILHHIMFLALHQAGPPYAGVDVAKWAISFIYSGLVKM